MIEGIDITSGLARVAGNRRLYVDLRRSFAHGQAAIPHEIANALEKNDPELAERLSHTLRGTAGNLGVGSVQAIAAKLEQQIRERNQPDEIGDSIEQLDSALRSTVERIQVAFPEEGARAETKDEKKPPRELLSVLIKLYGLIEESDSEALDLFETIRESLEAAAPLEEVTNLRKSLQVYEFRTALSSLKRIKAALGTRGKGKADDANG